MDETIFSLLNSWAFWDSGADVLIVFSAVFIGYWMIAGALAFGFFTVPPLSVVSPNLRRFRKKNWRMISFVLASAILARFGVVELIRLFYDRPRPFEVLSGVNQLIFRDGGASFPSGHTAFYFALAAAFSFYYPKTGILFFLAAIFMSIGRVAVGVHWPSDILGGALVGILTPFILRQVFPRFSK